MELPGLGQLERHELNETITDLQFYLGQVSLHVVTLESINHPTLWIPSGENTRKRLAENGSSSVVAIGAQKTSSHRRLTTLALPPETSVNTIQVNGAFRSVYIQGKSDRQREADNQKKPDNSPFIHKDLSVTIEGLSGPESSSIVIIRNATIGELNVSAGALLLNGVSAALVKKHVQRYSSNNPQSDYYLREPNILPPVNPLIYARHPDTPEELRGHPLL